MLEHLHRSAGADAWRLRQGSAVDGGRTIVARLGGGVDHEVYAVEDHRFGRSVAKLVRPQLVAAGEACGVAAREAAALQRLAALGVVRCLDVKPENIIAGPRARLLDFNTARPAADARRLRFAIGTPAYMAPEQRAAGGPAPWDPLGPPADVYALAVTLHEALTGRLPRADDRPSTPLGGLLAAALARDPARRPTAAELGAGLRAAIAGGDRASAVAD